MAEEKLILLDRKNLLLDLSVLCEFAPHAKVEKSAIEGKGKLSVIQAIRHKIEDLFENLTGDDQRRPSHCAHPESHQSKPEADSWAETKRTAVGL